MTTASPPVMTAETAATIAKRHNAHVNPATKPDRAKRSLEHCNLMAPMSDDKRIQYLNDSGYSHEVIQLITHATSDSFGRTAKPSLQAAVNNCAKASKEIESLLAVWPEDKHFQLFDSKLNKLNDEQKSLAIAYAHCQIYEKAATALYLIIVDGMTPITNGDIPDPDTMERDRDIAEAGYTDEVGRWPK